MKNRKIKTRKSKKTLITVIIVLIVAILAVTAFLVWKIKDSADNNTQKTNTESVTTNETVNTDIQIDTSVIAEDTTVQPSNGEETVLPNSNYTKYQTGEAVSLNPNWKYASFSAINTGSAVYYKATSNANGIVIAVNAGHGTSGGSSQKTYCHPDQTPKVTGGSTAQGATMATAVAGGMSFNDGTAESTVTLNMARILRDKLLACGYDVIMLRDAEDVQLDNIARTVIANNTASCHISLHWDGDSNSYDKGVFYAGVPDGIKYLETVSAVWEKSEALGQSIIGSLASGGYTLYNNGRMEIDLTQTSYSTIPSIDLELGNQCSDISSANLSKMADRIVVGISGYFG